MRGWSDLLIVLGFAVALPVLDLLETPKLRAAVRAGVPGALRRDYQATMIVLWGFTALTVGLWIAANRDWAALGFAAPGGWRFWTGAAVTVLLAVLLLIQPDRLARDPKASAAVREQLEPVAWYVPTDRAELRAFNGVSLTAGICEEILYRGYLIWFLEPYFGLWPAVAVSTLLFGAAHLYLGVAGAVRATLAGAVLAALYLFTGSLWAPIVLHVAIDLGSGRTGYLVREAAGSPAEVTSR